MFVRYRAYTVNHSARSVLIHYVSWLSVLSLLSQLDPYSGNHVVGNVLTVS